MNFVIEFIIELLIQKYSKGKKCALINTFTSSKIFKGNTTPEERQLNLQVEEIFSDLDTLYICPFFQDQFNPDSINNYLLLQNRK